MSASETGKSLTGRFLDFVSPRSQGSNGKPKEVKVSTVFPDEDSVADSFEEVRSVNKESPTLSGFSTIPSARNNKSPTASVMSAKPAVTRITRSRAKSNAEDAGHTTRYEPDEDEKRMDESEAQLDSEDDEAMTDLDNRESEAESDVESEPELESITDLIRLGEAHCRVACQVTDRHGAKHHCICGKRTAECIRHFGKRAASESGGGHQLEIGWYKRVIAKSGKAVHGKIGLRLSDKAVEAQKLTERDEMTKALKFLQDENTNKAEDRELQILRSAETRNEDPTKDLQVAFDRTEIRAGPPNYQRPAPVHEPKPVKFYGMRDHEGGRHKAKGWDQAVIYFKERGIGLDQKFETEAECDMWVASGPIPGTLRNTREAVQPPIQGSPSRTPKRSNKLSDYTSPSESDSTSAHGRKHKESDRRSKSKKSKKKKKSKGKARKGNRSTDRRRKSRRKHRTSGKYDDPSSSSSSSSSDSSSDSEHHYSSSSEDSDSSATTRSSRRSKRSKQKRQKQTTKKRSTDYKFSGKDESAGDKSKIYGFELSRNKIDKAIGPAGLRSDDAPELYAAMVDVTALPGMIKTSDMYDETETAIDHMATALLANTADRKKGVHLDSLYDKPSRHALGKIKSGENLLKLVGQLNKAKVSAFENQSFYLQAFLVRRGYSDDEIDEYLQQGPLIRIIEKTYQYYSQFLGKLRDLHYEHEKRWENGPAVVLLEYHSDKLFHIRRTSVNRKIHLLRTYTYLRDAAADNFNTSDLNEALWSRLTKISQEVNLGESNDGGKNNGGKPRPTGEGKTTCTLCGSRELHSLHKVGHNAGACPLAGQDADKIVRMRKKIMRVYKLDKSKDIKKVLQDTTSTWGDQQDS